MKQKIFSISAFISLTIIICSSSLADELESRANVSPDEWQQEKKCIKEVTDYLVHFELGGSTFSGIFKSFISSGRYSACEMKEIIFDVASQKK